ncbi:Mco10p KNAG_0B03250 [Huiozyma naganishii CBS 8797]|uniref:Uncharacterized protein n=1 Tax=Huiozyma naganishii (strain ATCC MYA-139 / BCRC 22969 / CBS 8797 / KCTC 17520 / NBRC 10181 / NCYC 3082 / Yp74L-3) TaxID=1071383 RepID=J7S4S5_HUIN7|nr:hypothetical protein KNAG_0B03250 [Kazachstania naganishii CBS 8797]CCK68766.1 hypothetical protein KNAG_0B03250 [Kazachstania naganishii CBS 8797]
MSGYKILGRTFQPQTLAIATLLGVGSVAVFFSRKSPSAAGTHGEQPSKSKVADSDTDIDVEKLLKNIINEDSTEKKV